MGIQTFLPQSANPPAAGRYFQSSPKLQQRGAIAIMFSVLLILIIGFMGLALDLSRLYNRKVELQAMADAAALAAARNLVGTSGGVNNAVAAPGAAATSLNYDYSHTAMPWSPSALKFSTSATGAPWVDAATASAAPDAVMFAKVDTSTINADLGVIDTIFMSVLAPELATATTAAEAIAGRSTIKVSPLAICAMSSNPGSSRSPGAELVQYGFRRGVGYDLMNLNPNPAATAGETFVINPIDPAGQLGSSSNTLPDIVGPFACAGAMPMQRVMGATLTVGRPFPIGSLYNQLNSRFDDYSAGSCKYQSAPPDFNVKQFDFVSSVNWMKNPQPTRQTAKSATTNDYGLRTIADYDNSSANTADQFGPLWTFSKPVPFSAYTAGVAEPVNGYTPFPKTTWPTLFFPASTMPDPKSTYPSATPYAASGGANFLAPNLTHGRGLLLRRVLNVPLLDCPVTAGTNVQASVLAIGRFFMTVKATPTSITGEFAGIAAEGSLGGAVELYK